MLVLAVLVWSSIYEIASSLELSTKGSKELWTFIGDDVHFRCKLPSASSHFFCNSTKRSKMWNFYLSDNSEENRRYIRRHARIRCKMESVSVVFKNVTQRSTGMYWCAGDSDNFIDVNVIDRVRKPKNISCIFYNKRILRCNYSVLDRVGFNQYSCSAHPIKLGNKCLAHEYPNMEWNNVTGSCTYKCGSCTDNVSLFIRARNAKENRTYCHRAVLKHLIKPGPVRNLKLVHTNTTAVGLEWNKPDDEDNDFDTYIYTEDWSSNTFTSKDDLVRAVIRYLRPGQNYTFIVRAKPRRKGYQSEPVYLIVTTLEDVPTSGPMVPDGSFSISEQGVVAVYWQHVPEKDRGGKLVSYKVETDSKTVTIGAENVCALLNMAQPLQGDITIKLTAATRVGFSPPTILKIDMKEKDAMQVSSVIRDGNITRWSTQRTSQHTARVHRCYGSIDLSTQLVDCKTEVEYEDVEGGVTESEWLSPPVPTLQCSHCAWQYAVSLHHGNITGGMVWVTGTDGETRPGSWFEGVITITITVVCVVPVFLIFIIVFLYKKKVCDGYTIILPKDTNFYMQKEIVNQNLLTNKFRDIRVKTEDSCEEVQCTTEETVISDVDQSGSGHSSDHQPHQDSQEEIEIEDGANDPAIDTSGLSLYRFQPDEVVGDSSNHVEATGTGRLGTLVNSKSEVISESISQSAPSVGDGRNRHIQDLPSSCSTMEKDEVPNELTPLEEQSNRDAHSVTNSILPLSCVTKCDDMKTLESSSETFTTFHDCPSAQLVTCLDKNSSESELQAGSTTNSCPTSPCTDKCHHSRTNSATSINQLSHTHVTTPKPIPDSSSMYIETESDFMHLKSKSTDPMKVKPRKPLSHDPSSHYAGMDSSVSSYSYVSLSIIEAQNQNRTPLQDMCSEVHE